MEDILYQNSTYWIRTVPGKGYGIVAAGKIAKGTRILFEAPLIRVPRNIGCKDQLQKSIAAKLASFPPNYGKAYFELQNMYREESPEVGVALTNILPLGPKSPEHGVFMQASRLNHSCLPNAQETWNEKAGKLSIHACRDVAGGEEITISFLSKRSCYEIRQLTLKTQFHFRCICSLCSMTPAKRKLSDARQEEIQKLDNQVNSPMVHLYDPLNTLHNVERCLKLMMQEGIEDVSVPDIYFVAFQVAISHGDEARAKVFADRALYNRRTVEGYDSPIVGRLEQLSNHPFRHLSYGITSKWKSSIFDAPTGFSRADFDLWLWRQEKPRELRFANLRCASTFPAFKDLPGGQETNADFFEATDAFKYQPKKHWAFLGDILSVNEREGVDLKLVVEDKNWRKVQVVIRTAEFGDEWDHSLVKQGNTIVILYPVKDEDVDENPGLVVDKLEALKV